MPQDKSGQIVWHDLFSTDRQRSMTFYERVAGWSFAVEHATDFAWGGGQVDFVLAMLADEAGAGFIKTPEGMSDGWIAYAEVPNVDSASKYVEPLGGEVIRAPFDVPGVGRNALVRDPLGAVVGISQSQHAFPIPARQFGNEIYLTGTSEFPTQFYSEVFGWSVSPPHDPQRGGAVISSLSGQAVAHHLPGLLQTGVQASWVPCINVVNTANALRAAKALDASQLSKSIFESMGECRCLIRDPDGALFCLSAGG
ncbi:VOC family protein [uncultured Tateyamaria sp.]|uniref:VOC family protein n=1 Tax=uncultured Tateyamaria sp. TaxID=455651 RepID=UPI00260D4A73|nr:VOC family protein [uncultured Tateyamaria sp.]